VAGVVHSKAKKISPLFRPLRRVRKQIEKRYFFHITGQSLLGLSVEYLEIGFQGRVLKLFETSNDFSSEI
jgi:hypothetical protein